MAVGLVRYGSRTRGARLYNPWGTAVHFVDINNYSIWLNIILLCVFRSTV